GQTADWARLELSEAVSVTPLRVDDGVASAGLAVALAGYNQDRAQLLMADLGCHVQEVARMPGGVSLLAHDCAGTRGTSGGPLLTRQGADWVVIAINIAASRAENLALAAPFGP
ncbi:MAG TPA: hypothetical protein VGS13_16190, partial [Stellaceae bacterium]|nr:hypothetical protein [Stellaceae bacterium]